jgi:hypothetical protein
MHSILLAEDEPNVHRAWQGTWMRCGARPSGIHET